jgi:hypothetical protein
MLMLRVLFAHSELTNQTMELKCKAIALKLNPQDRYSAFQQNSRCFVIKLFR